jgi:hypothetical protein
LTAFPCHAREQLHLASQQCRLDWFRWHFLHTFQFPRSHCHTRNGGEYCHQGSSAFFFLEDTARGASLDLPLPVSSLSFPSPSDPIRSPAAAASVIGEKKREMGGDSPPPPPSSSAPVKVYYEGCPGCAMERKKESHRGQGVPYKELLFVAVTTLAAGTCSPSRAVLFYSILSDVGFGYSFFIPSQLHARQA